MPGAEIVGVPAISDSAPIHACDSRPNSKCPACPSARGMGWGMGVVRPGKLHAAAKAGGHGSGTVVVIGFPLASIWKPL